MPASANNGHATTEDRVARVYDRASRVYDVFVAPMEWFGLYDSDDQVLELLRSADFSEVEARLPAGKAGGRLAVATA